MNKIFCTIIFVIILTSPLFTLAQRDNTSWVSANMGVNTDWILNQNTYGNPEMAYRSKFNFSGDVSFKKFTNGYGYSVGIGIGNLGQNYSDKMAGADAKRSLSLTYLQLPVMGMYNLGGYNAQRWLSFGAQFMYLLSAKQVFNRSEGRSLANPEMLLLGNTDVITRFKPYDMMLRFEFTNIYPIAASNKIKTLVSFNGAYGLIDINNKEYRIPNAHNVYAGSHNFYLGIHVGIMYNLKEKSRYTIKSHGRKHVIKPFNR